MTRGFLENVTDLKAHIADVKSEVERDNSVWLFQHVQKTAGTSLVTEIRQTLKLNYLNIHLLPHEYEGYTHKKFNTSIRRRADEIQDPKLQAISGHFVRMHMDTIESLRSARLFTFAREPVTRVISGYRYQRSPVHPTHEAFRRDFPKFEDWVEFDESQNLVAHAICKYKSMRDIDKALARFEFIGTTERYALSFRLMSAFLEKPRFPKIHANKTEDTDDNQIEVTPALREHILRLNEVDAYVHRRAVEVLERLRPQILALKTPPETESVKD